MSRLRVTLIDVGWGDSAFLEAQDEGGEWHYALVDSNDSATLRSSHIFLKRFFDRQGVRIGSPLKVFDWVLMSHAHADHGQGLKKILADYGTGQFWYPKTEGTALFLTALLRYAHRSRRVEHHQSVDATKTLPEFGGASMQILWPKRDEIDRNNENNNSVVLTLTLDDVCFVLTGDAEAEVWEQISTQIPANTRFFKVPHHGSPNGTFDSHHGTPWLDRVSQSTKLAISCHVSPFPFPHHDVTDVLDQRGEAYFRTDLHYHVTFETDGQDVTVKYSHV